MSTVPAPAPAVWAAGQGEEPVVARLLVEFRDWQGRDWPSENAFLAGVERLMGAAAAEYLLASPGPDSPPAGVCQLRYRYGLWMAAEDCCLEDLFVSERARRSGVGAALMAAALARARERGCRRVELDVDRENPAAVALYGRFGFSARGGSSAGGESLLMRRLLEEG